MKETETKQICYKIRIEGHLKRSWADWLNGMVTSMQNRTDELDFTIITVHVPYQAALRGLLNKLWDQIGRAHV